MINLKVPVKKNLADFQGQNVYYIYHINAKYLDNSDKAVQTQIRCHSKQHLI